MWTEEGRVREFVVRMADAALQFELQWSISIMAAGPGMLVDGFCNPSSTAKSEAIPI